MARNTGALLGANAAPSTAPPTVGGSNAEVRADYSESVTVENSRSAARVTNTASAHAVEILHWSVAVVIAALVLLWVFGGIVFRNANI